MKAHTISSKSTGAGKHPAFMQFAPATGLDAEEGQEAVTLVALERELEHAERARDATGPVKCFACGQTNTHALDALADRVEAIHAQIQLRSAS